ncbi:MAG: metal-dependent transcriptional regulator [Firmicutes bacterium]|nr:metal-dependent transcriptional regulator [Bacillota bacterium]
MRAKIQESSEDYLETILILSQRNQYVRSIDIVNELGFSKPSVSVAMKKLRENGQIIMDDSGYISLTESGMAVATKVYERHQALTRLFEMLGVGKETAADDACRVEHVISDETFDRLKDHIEKLEQS